MCNAALAKDLIVLLECMFKKMQNVYLKSKDPAVVIICDKS